MGLQGIPLTRLPPALAALAPHLMDLDLESTSERGLWAGGEAQLAPPSSLTALTRLDLTSCKLERLPPELASLRSLAELDLSLNRPLGGQRGESAAHASAKWAPLKQLTALTRLDASICQLRAVPAALAALPALQVLRLAGNSSMCRCGGLGD